MADKKDNPQIKKNLDEISAFDSISKKILSSIDSGYNEREVLNSKDARFQAIINREIDIPKGISNGNIVDFSISQFNSGTRGKYRDGSDVDSSSIFTQDVGEIFNYFQDVYKNKYIEMADLKFISKFIPALGEAVKTTLDSIVSSDDVSSTITRSLILSSSLSTEDSSAIISEIEKIEEDEKLLKKLKNVVYKKTLISGRYYIYAVPYKTLFKEYDNLKASGRFDTGFMGSSSKNTKILKQNTDKGFNMGNESIITMESFQGVIEDMKNDMKSDSQYKNQMSILNEDINNFTKNLEDHIGSVYVVPSSINTMYEAIESMGALDFYKTTFKETNISDTMMVDGTKNMSTEINNGTGDFDAISGTYLKYIDSKNIIPIKIFNQIVGYYHIHATPRRSKNVNGSLVGSNNSLFSSVNFTEQRKEEAINNIVDTISDGIMSNFSDKFVANNQEHKRMIADCIIANGIVDNDYNIQFIPAEHMVEFIINEDENGYGESILADSLFPAKLLLSLIICKMLNYMNKSGNKTIAHVFKGPIDVSTSNQLQRVVRMLQESNITFNDLLSTNLVFSKFSRDSNIQLPTAKNGNKLVEFEVQEGQNVDLGTDFEDKLEDMAIIGTGVPSVIMDYTNSVDYAKQIVSANIKFAGRISSLQADLEESTTRLYKILIANSNLSDELKTKCLNKFAFKLPRPKALSNANNSDFLRTSIDNATAIADTIIGSVGGDNPDNAKIKDKLVKSIVTNDSQFLDWSLYEEMYEEAKLEIQGSKEIKPSPSQISGNEPMGEF